MFVLYSVPVWIWLASLKPKNALNYLVHHHSCQLGGYPESIWVVWKIMMMIPKQWSLSPDEGTLWHVKVWRSVKMEHITNVVESTNDIVQFHNPKCLRLWNWAFFSILFDNLTWHIKNHFFHQLMNNGSYCYFETEQDGWLASTWKFPSGCFGLHSNVDLDCIKINTLFSSRETELEEGYSSHLQTVHHVIHISNI